MTTIARPEKIAGRGCSLTSFAPTARRASALFDAGQLELVVGGQWWTPRRRIGSRAQDARAR